MNRCNPTTMKAALAGAVALLGLLTATAQAKSVLADAAMRGDDQQVQTLLKERADVNAAQPDGATALHWAVYRDDLALTKQLLAKGAKVDVRNADGATPLSLAAINGNAAIIKDLLAKGAKVDGKLQHGETALMLASRTGSVDAIALLLDRGADINAVESLRGTNALMWASANHNPAAVKLLLARGADVKALSATTALGRGPYLADTAKDRIEAFHLGVGQAGRSVPVSLEADDPNPTESSGLAADVIAAARKSQGATPAAPKPPATANAPAGSDAPSSEGGETEGPRPRNDQRGGGLTALVFAAREGDADTVRLLIAGGADVNQVTNYGWTPLLAAIQNRQYQLAKLLLESGADPNIANKGGWTPLYIATDNRNIEGGDYPTRKPDMDHLQLINLLLARGANTNGRMHSSTETRTIFTHQWLYEEGATPFLRAAQSGDLVLMKLLLQHGADPHINSDAGVTPLMVAAGIGWVEGVTYEWSPEQTLDAIKLLLELGADVNARDAVDGRTALMGAAHKGRSDVVQVLADHRADLSIRDVGSRDSIHVLAGTTWQAIDYADGLVRVGVQSAIAHPQTANLMRKLMVKAGLPAPPEGRTLESICVTSLCK